jgi:protein-L-isoaspartate(D-aspartate) O-methyltransferase
VTELVETRKRFAQELRRTAQLRTEGLVRAFSEVPRESFLPPGPWSVWNMATWTYERTPDADPARLYFDAPVGIDPTKFLNNGQPSFVAGLIDALELRSGESVAHVGAGTGYFTAAIATTVGPKGSVTAIEVDSELAAQAARNLSPWRQVTIVNADGCQHDFGQVDAILVNAGASAPRPLWLDSLRPGGRLVLPLARWASQGKDAGESGKGIVFRVERRGDAYAAGVLRPVAIFPCVGGIDPEADQSLAEAMARPEQGELIRSLRRDKHERHSTCWLHGAGYCFSQLPVEA